ncbi:MAG: hypothetical protein IIX15_01550 [Clostridia bacterium]|nr:hypothetical protein [Clostridia bacterium]
MKRFIVFLLCALLLVSALGACEQKTIEITDISFSEGVDYPSALEVFWEDDEYEYVFGAIMAWDCTVYYSDGTSENLIDALKSGHVTVEDLNDFEVDYYKERK